MDILQYSAAAAQLILDSIHRQALRSECCRASVDSSYPEDPVCSQCGQHCMEYYSPPGDEPPAA